MLQEALKQVEIRLPSSSEIFRGLSLLSPMNLLNQFNRAPFQNLPMRHLLKNDESKLDCQYRNIVVRKWQEDVFEGQILEDSVQFWQGVAKYTDASGNHPFKELSHYSLSCLSTPISNASVERMFLYVTIIKSKIRNQMSLELLETLMRIKTTLAFDKICCNKFKPSQEMYELFNTSVMYKSNKSSEEEDEQESTQEKELQEMLQIMPNF